MRIFENLSIHQTHITKTKYCCILPFKTLTNDCRITRLVDTHQQRLKILKGLKVLKVLKVSRILKDLKYLKVLEVLKVLNVLRVLKHLKVLTKIWCRFF